MSVSKSFIVFILLIIVITITWFFPIVPAWKKCQADAWCKCLVFSTSKSLLISNEYSHDQIIIKNKNGDIIENGYCHTN